MDMRGFLKKFNIMPFLILCIFLSSNLVYADEVSFLRVPVGSKARIEEVLEGAARERLRAVTKENIFALYNIIAQRRNIPVTRDQLNALSNHGIRVSRLCKLLCRDLEIGKDEQAMRDLDIISLLHDLGKLGNGEVFGLVHFPGELNEVEFILVRSHALLTLDILKEEHIEVPAIIERIIRYQHDPAGLNSDPFFPEGSMPRMMAEVFLLADFTDGRHDMSRPYHNNSYHSPLISDALEIFEKRYPEVRLSAEVRRSFHRLISELDIELLAILKEALTRTSL